MDLPDSWRRSKLGMDAMHRPSLLSRVRPGEAEDEDTGPPNDRGPQEPRKATKPSPRGMALYVEPEAHWKPHSASPWARVQPTTANVAARAAVCFLGGTRVEARRTAGEIAAQAQALRKTTPTILRRLFREEADDPAELSTAAGEFDGFLVPANGNHDAAVSFERTRRRVVSLIDMSLARGWTRAPVIALESPNDDWTTRIPEGICEMLVVDVADRDKKYVCKTIIVPVGPHANPWWQEKPNFLYAFKGEELFWESWMQDPLTFSEQSR